MCAARIRWFRLATASGLLLTLLLARPAAAAESASPVQLPGGGVIERVDFERHVMGLFGRMGCNAGSCHGSFQGKGGFRLSLFGYDPSMDFLALTRDGMGRRINHSAPDNSLVLLKASGQLPHGGKTRFSKDSWGYRLLRAWIVQGAHWEKGSGTVTAVSIDPPEYVFTRPGQEGRLRVHATFADGAREDITPLCDFRTNDDAIAQVTPLGELKAVRPGDTAIVVSYRGNVIPVRVLVPAQVPAGFRYPKVAQVNYIDREVQAKLRRLNMVPSGLCSDSEFLRRVTLDTLGTLPTPAELRAFLADKSPNKRARKIDELLTHPMHAALWATKFCDILGNNSDSLEAPRQLGPRLSQMWHDWLRKRLAANVPYDQLVHDILCATSREGKSPEEYVKHVKKTEDIEKAFNRPYADRATLDLFWRRQQQVPPDQWGQKTAAAFLGVRLECAECHKHPFDRWTQVDYRAYGNIFGPITFGVSPEAQKLFRSENAERNKRRKGGKGVRLRAPLREVFVAQRSGRVLPHPDTLKPLSPKALGGPEITVERGEDPREALFVWMRSPDNPFFARSFVNRVWGHYFGTGIVHPVDDFSLANPPSNAKLLDALAQDFIEHKYDIRQIERRILNSHTYQLASATNETNKLDHTNYSHSYVRPLMAEVVVDALNTALGVSDTFGPELPAGARAIEVGASRVQNNTADFVFRIFGRPPRSTACDCERAMDPALPQKLYLMADPSMVQKLRAPGNRLRTLLASKKSDDEVLEELFLACLSRLPTKKERAVFADYRAQHATRQAAFEDLTWALVNRTEFIFNH